MHGTGHKTGHTTPQPKTVTMTARVTSHATLASVQIHGNVLSVEQMRSETSLGGVSVCPIGQLRRTVVGTAESVIRIATAVMDQARISARTVPALEPSLVALQLVIAILDGVERTVTSGLEPATHYAMAVMVRVMMTAPIVLREPSSITTQQITLLIVRVFQDEQANTVRFLLHNVHGHALLATPSDQTSASLSVPTVRSDMLSIRALTVDAFHAPILDALSVMVTQILV